MSRKNDSYYFDMFVKSAECACNASVLLDDILKNFSRDTLSDRMQELHEIEHTADSVKHDLMNSLLRAFITPIEREDIMKLAHNIDDVVDAIDDIAMRLYINNITHIRRDCLEISELVMSCCAKTKEMLAEFADFKKSKTIMGLIIEINHLEEEADKHYIAAMHRLHTESKDPFEVIAWREVYDCFECVCDACEHVADVAESAIIANT